MTRGFALAVAILVAIGPAASQQQASAPASSSQAAPATQQELDSLLAPIALYPDSLIAQILMASTYPLEVVLAARWSKEHPNVQGTAVEDAMQKETWDPSVKSLTAVPQVLKQMSDNLSWTQKLGDAFLADQPAVMKTIQSLRAKAKSAGNLKSTKEQKVTEEVVDSQTMIVIEPAQAETMYVPVYDPYTVYGSWWWSYPPYYMYPPGYYYAPGVAFAAGIIIGGAIWGGIGWGGGGNNVYIDHHKYNNFNRTDIGGGDRSRFNHNVDHRKGVAYGDNKVAQKYNRASDNRAIQSREQFRARADQGRAELRSMDAGQLQSRIGSGNAGGSGRFDAGGGSRDFGGGRSPSVSTRDAGVGSRGSSGFSGAGLGSSSREASSRGSASRGSMGGGRAGGGARGGGGRR
jgi:uncharacterized membrane protein YgcG